MNTPSLNTTLRIAEEGDSFITHQEPKGVIACAHRMGVDVKVSTVDLLQSSIPLHQQMAERTTLVTVISKDGYIKSKRPRVIK